MAKRANGTGTVRKVTRMIGGKKYEYWEARYTDGVDLGTGKQRRRSITGKTQKEVMQKLKATTAAIDSGTYIQPSKQTLGQWLDVWEKTYLSGVKPRTRAIYADNIRLHIKPALGAVRSEALNTHEIQQFYNALGEPSRTRKAGLAPKTIKDIHGVLHKALRQAVEIGYLRFNPADACKLPRVERKELAPLDDAQITAFLQTIKGSRFETLLTVTLFTGMREGEVLGLTWDNVDFKAGTVTISKQALLHESEAGDGFRLGSTKNGKSRTIAPASAVMALLKQHKGEQAKQRLKVSASCGGIRRLCLPTRSDGLSPRRRYTVLSRKRRRRSDVRTPAFTISGTPTPWPRSAPATISRPCRAIWATPRQPLRSMFTAM